MFLEHKAAASLSLAFAVTGQIGKEGDQPSWFQQGETFNTKMGQALHIRKIELHISVWVSASRIMYLLFCFCLLSNRRTVKDRVWKRKGGEVWFLWLGRRHPPWRMGLGYGGLFPSSRQSRDHGEQSVPCPCEKEDQQKVAWNCAWKV